MRDTTKMLNTRYKYMYLFIFLMLIASCKTQHVVQVERDTVTKFMEHFTNENHYETIKIYNIKEDSLKIPKKSLVKIIERHFVKQSEDNKKEQNVQAKHKITKTENNHKALKWYDYLLYIAIIIVGYFLYFVINTYRKRGYNW